MKKNCSFLRRGTSRLLLVMSLFWFNGCTIGYHDNEIFESDVKNSTLKSPTLEDVDVSIDAAGEVVTVEWAVVHGAEGYEFSWYNVDDPNNPLPIVENEFVDGCRIQLNVLEDTNYKFLIRTIGSKNFNNKDAESACEINYSTLVETYKSIPNGADLATWFAENPLPETDETPNEDGTLKELAYELEPGGEYTVSAPVDLGARKVTLRGSKVNRAKVTLGESGRFETQNGLKLKFMNIFCGAQDKDNSSSSLIALSTTPNEALKVASGEYVIKEPIVLQNCNIYDVNRHLFYDSSKKYCVENLTVKGCYVRFNQSNTLVLFKSGSYINMTFKESTMYSTVQNGNYFAQVNGNRPNKITGYSTATFAFESCTLHNIAYSKDFTNWNSYRGQSVVTLKFFKNIFVDCGKGDMTNKIMGNANMGREFEYNTYWYNGVRSNDKFDTNALGTDPAFTDAANSNFTVNGTEQIEKRTGDPRWLPIVEE